jgi:hypothetical protein
LAVVAVAKEAELEAPAVWMGPVVLVVVEGQADQGRQWLQKLQKR